MKNITVKDIINITNATLLNKIDDNEKSKLLSEEVTDIVTDSREVKPNTLFVAIVGENVDAHKFIPDVAKITDIMLIEKGEDEILALSDKSSLPDNKAYILVNSTLDALQLIGGYIRSIYEKKVIGVTGSVGKTTTREMITHALRSSLNVFSTSGNMNSQIGVPLTLSHMNDTDSDIAVLEMGISEPGGMDKLTKMVMPDIAVCTMIGVAHIEFMKTREGIMHEKLRIASRMNDNGVLFINSDDSLLSKISSSNDISFITDGNAAPNCKIMKYGTGSDADYRATDIRYMDGYNTYTYVHEDKKVTVNLTQSGMHNVLNSLVAMAICDYLGLDTDKAAEALENFEGMRQKEIMTDKGYTVIDDTYNASPDSMKALISVLRDKPAHGRRIAVLGDMFELGPNSDEYHREVGRFIKKCYSENNDSINELITVGISSKLIAEEIKDTDILINSFEKNMDASEYIKSIIKPADIIVLKASNGMKFSEIVKEIV
ncbi:UDP-N-acetylmuramoyl-tripeptide--D-alanyl-D-alanine ligase [Lachnospiraceae bacterium]|nr:UDP-N-acetylmuramoyl-tripeptide--D-alanyl-D-alanine ligase [Lachnospiraceae bacterium]